MSTAEIMRGIPAITRFLGEDWSERKVRYAADCGVLPIFKMAGRWCARPQSIIAEIEKREAEALARGRAAPGDDAE